jgi:hypothetical protein
MKQLLSWCSVLELDLHLGDPVLAGSARNNLVTSLFAILRMRTSFRWIAFLEASYE